jgi:hypothetical protein
LIIQFAPHMVPILVESAKDEREVGVCLPK